MNVKFQPRRHMIDLIFTLALFCVFAASALMVVLIGADVYRSATHNMDTNFNLQTSLHYIATKIHQNDTAGAVFTGQLDNQPALILEQNENDSLYRTYIYEYNGQLCELFTAIDSGASCADGSAIMDITSFSAEPISENLLRIRCSTDNAKPAERIIGTRCAIGREDTP